MILPTALYLYARTEDGGGWVMFGGRMEYVEAANLPNMALLPGVTGPGWIDWREVE